MDRLNGASCYTYSKDGRYIGKYRCAISIEEDISTGNIIVLQTKKQVKIVIKEMRENLKHCSLKIVNHINGKYYMLEIDEIKDEEFDGEDKWFWVYSEDITSKIEDITKENYEQLKNTGQALIEWDKIRTSFGSGNMTKDKAFEELCVDIINEIKMTTEGNFHSRGGTDGGRDYIWEWSEIENTNLDFLDLPKSKWIMQCKYSSDIEQKLQKPEVWDEIVKVIPYTPNHYIIFTNRKRTSNFDDWWKEIIELSGRKKYLIPFSLHMVGREDLERLLNLYPEVKEKYFGIK